MMPEGLLTRKSRTATELSSSSEAVRTLRMAPGSWMTSPRCMKKIPPMTRATMARPMPKAARKLSRMGSAFAHDLHDFVHGFVGSGDEGAIEEMGFEADLVFIAVVIEGGEDGAPIFFFGALGHDAFAFDLDVEHARDGEESVAFGVGLLYAVGVVRVPRL